MELRNMRQALLVFFVLVVLVKLTSATIVYKPLSMAFADLPAKFAVGVNSSGACGALVKADPLNGCSPIRNEGRGNETEKARFALIIRGECAFKDKIQNAQNAGFGAAIVYDDRDGADLVYMMIDGENTTIHAVFVSKATGELLKEHAHDEEGECCIFPFEKETAWTVLAISFFSFIVILSILILVIFAPRHWLYIQGRNQLPKSVDTKVVEALPCFTFSSARLGECHSEEACAICLDNYKDGDILKVLPCQHEFHSSCVDSWLTKWGTCCPVCKHDMKKKSVNPEVRGSREGPGWKIHECVEECRFVKASSCLLWFCTSDCITLCEVERFWIITCVHCGICGKDAGNHLFELSVSKVLLCEPC